ncbi:MAG: HAMP domain-containing histidine kinase [Alphaproteobacteria bacterium]|nr:HAMP domain-containing histidine kinase [Alphaproteobacteria bacterium]
MWSSLSQRLEATLPGWFRGGLDQPARRARRILWLTAGLAPLHLLSATLSTLIRGPNHLAGFLLLGGIAVSVTPLLLHAFRTTAPAAVWFLAVNFVAVSAVAWTGYGPLSPANLALVLLPVVGMVIGGPRIGAPFTVVSVAQLGALVAADRAGFVFPLDPSGPRFLLTHTLVLAGVLVVVMVFLRTYDQAWRQASAQSERAQRDLMLASEAKSAFLANMSHELRTPLAAVIGYTELLLEDAPDAEQADLRRIEESSRHLLALVDQLLDLAKIEAGKLELASEAIAVDELARRVLDEVRPLAEKRRAMLVHEVPALRARADGLRVRQVLLNLLSNACKFCEDGTITLRAWVAGDRVRIEVEDTGVGMTAAELARVFEPFEQGEAGARQGTGLGLTISRSLTEAMGGSLTARSTPGVGTCFCVELPLHP